MAIEIKCNKCGRELVEPGILIFDRPDVRSHCRKLYVCVRCRDELRAWMNNNPVGEALSELVPRYKREYFAGHGEFIEVKADDGDWVKWEDVLALFALGQAVLIGQEDKP